ncbi:MAG TPA: Cys-tRNA(Pro) deacylase [Croceibacterium sp.]
MGRSTRATKALEAARVAFTVHEYDYDPGADRVGLQAAEALGEAPARVLKTLMVLVDGQPACAILASDRELSMKKLAAALGGKAAAMMPPHDAERITGYKVGGISPFGQTRVTRFVLDAAAAAHELVFVNAGQRGLQVRLSPGDAAAALRAKVADVHAGAG